MPANLHNLVEGWMELESDPGLFTLLLEDFGVNGVQLEEIYDLEQPLNSPVYGFVFLFRWTDEPRRRKKTKAPKKIFVKDELAINSIFFARQMIPNSCASHALVSILLNCSNIHLGKTLERLKEETRGMNPENKGWAIGNTPELARAHNSHATPVRSQHVDETPGVTTGQFTSEAYHFVSYVPINGHLYELDGLNSYPMDHGPWAENENWTDKFLKVIKDRLAAAFKQCGDIRFNLMAVIPDKRLAICNKLKFLNLNRQIALEALKQVELVNNLEKKKKENDQLPSKSLISPIPSTSKGTKKRRVRPKLNKTVVTSVPSSSDGPESDKNPKNMQSVCLEAGGMPKGWEISSSQSSDKKENNGQIFVNDQLPSKSLISPIPSTSKGTKKRRVRPKLNKTVVTSVPSSSDGPESDKNPKNMQSVCLEAGGMPKGWEISSSQSSDKKENNGQIFVNDQLPSKSLISPIPSTSKGTKKRRVRPKLNKTVVTSVPSSSDGPESDKNPKNMQSVCLEAGGMPKGWEISSSQFSDKKDNNGQKFENNIKSNHSFSPEDLLAFVKSLESEININEGTLRDENEQRNKYKIDDCRRTHSYDQFITTFLTMLDDQGILPDLIQEELSNQKQNKITQLSQSQSTNQAQVKSKSIKKTSKSNTTSRKRKTATKKPRKS